MVNAPESKAPPPGIPADTLAFARRMFDEARTGNDEVLEQALAGGLPANLTNESGNTLLMLAAYAGHASTVTLIIRHGGDPNRLNDRGQSPLAGAIFKAHDAVARALLDGGADPRAGQPNAVDSAFMFGQKDKWFPVFGVSDADVSAGAPAPPSTARQAAGGGHSGS